jgi:predicted alpha/beta-hydrolase family hydrolase
MPAIEIETAHGPARAHLELTSKPRAALVLGHGAGGGISSRDLVTAKTVALEQQLSVVLVEQPYRVAGRRSPAPAHQLDAAWTTIVGQLCARELRGVRLVTGGRSSGARVACRTALQTGAAAVLCLAFPLVPPGRAEAKSRLPELDAVTVPTLVVQGERDPFGIPPPSATRAVALVAGDHSLRTDLGAQAEAIRAWLRRTFAP